MDTTFILTEAVLEWLHVKLLCQLLDQTDSGTQKQDTKEGVSSDGEKLLQRRIDQLVEKEKMELRT